MREGDAQGKILPEADHKLTRTPDFVCGPFQTTLSVKVMNIANVQAEMDKLEEEFAALKVWDIFVSLCLSLSRHHVARGGGGG